MFKVAREAVKLEIDRMRNRKILDATMAASALVATADGVVEFQELVALDGVIANVHALDVYDPHTAIDIYRRYAQGIIENPGEGTEQALQTVARLSGDSDDARLLIRACIAIGKSDGDFSDSEVAMIETMCGALNLNLGDVGDPSLPNQE